MQYLPNGTSANILGGHNGNTIGTGVGNVIAGGGKFSSANAIGSESDYNFIGSGTYNTIDGDYDVINGGKNNEIEGDYSVIGGGGGDFNDHFSRPSPEYDINSIKSDFGVVVGGRGNWIKANAHDATIGGGQGNTIESPAYVDPEWTGESGSVIAGGGNNTVEGYYGSIVGGHHNLVEGDLAFVGGGGRLSHHPPMGSSDPHDLANKAIGDWSVVVGGSNNIAMTNYTFIGGGEDNFIDNATGAAIVGGSNNVFSSATYSENANYSFIGGGRNNRMKAVEAVIVGGHDNEVVNKQAVGATWPADYAGILAGHGNKIWAEGGGIVAGWDNKISEEALDGFIGAGRQNTIFERASAATIGGGQANDIEADASRGTIGGGANNHIIAPPATTITGEINSLATIPGGDGLTAQSWAQTVIGGWNIPKGAVSFRYNNGTSLDRDDPILIIGNGSGPSTRSNAFEVSYNGHSIVYDQNNSGATNSAIRGGTYTDNVIYAWGKCNTSSTNNS